MSTPTAPLPQPALDAMHRLERLVAGMQNGESARFNGVTITPVSLEVAEAITVHKTAAGRAAKLAAKAAKGVNLPALDVRAWEFAEELMAGAEATLADAGMLHLIAADDHGKARDPQLPQRPRGPHPQTVGA